MPISVGEVNATLRFQVAQQSLQQAVAHLVKLQEEFRAAGGAATTSGQQIAISMEQARDHIAGLRSDVSNARVLMQDFGSAGATNIEQVGVAAENTSGAITQLDRLAVRMMERLALLYAFRATFQFTKDIYESADALNHFSMATDISIRTLQEWQYAGKEVEIPATKLNSAIEALQKNLAEMKPGASDALHEIGMSFDQIFSMSPDKQLQAIATAIEAIESPAERAKIEIQLFGTDAIDPLIKKYSELKAAADNSGLPDEHTVLVLSNATQQIKSMGVNLADFGAKAYAAGIDLTSGIIAPLFALKTGGVEAFKIAIAEANGFKVALDGAAKSLPLPPPMGQAFLDSLRTGIQLTDQQKVLLGQLNAMHELTVNNAVRAAGVTTAQYKAYVESLQEAKKAATEHAQAEKKAAEEAKQWQTVMDDLNSAGEGWRGTLNSIDGEVQEAVKYYLAAGVSQTTLAKAYALTQAQVKALASELADEIAVQKKAAAITAETALMQEQVWSKYAQVVSDYEATTLQKKIAANQRAYDDAVEKAVKRGVTDKQYYDSLFALMEKENQLATKNISDETKYSREHYEQLYKKAKEAYDAIMAHSEDHTIKEIELARKEMNEKLKASLHWRDQAIKDIDAVEKKDQTKTDKAISNAHKQAEAATHANSPKSGSGGGGGAGGHGKSGEELKGSEFTSSNEYDLSTPSGRAKVDPKIAKWLHEGYSLAQASALAFDEAWGIMPNANDPLFAVKGPRVPGFKEGVTNFEGGLAKVHKDELLVNLPTGTDVVPAGGGGDSGIGAQHNYFTINVHGPQDQHVRQMTDTIIKQLRSVQKFKNA